MALEELRNKLPNGDVGRVINSFIFASHPDTLDYIRSYRGSAMQFIGEYEKMFAEAVSAACILQGCWLGRHIESCWSGAFSPRVEALVNSGVWDYHRLGQYRYVRHLDKNCSWNMRFFRQVRLASLTDFAAWMSYYPEVSCRCCNSGIADYGPLIDLEDLYECFTRPSEGTSILERIFQLRADDFLKKLVILGQIMIG